MQINFTAPLCRTSYGLVGLNLMTALVKSGHQVSLFPIGHVDIPAGFESIAQTALANQHKFDPASPGLSLKEMLLPAECMSRKLRSLYTIFELDRLTKEQVLYLRSYDRVFVCSRWAQSVLIQHGIPGDRIGVVPLAVDTSIFHPDIVPVPARETIFVNIGKFELRKGQDLLLEAFNLAFKPGDPVHLNVHGWNHMYGADYNQFWIDMFKASPMGSQITVFEAPFASHQEVARVMANADCGIFPSRAEGWNLELLEMMALGKLVIATAYSGHTEFATPENCLLIEVSEYEDANDGFVFRGQGRWAKMGPSQLEQMIVHMRRVHQLKQSGSLERNINGIKTAQHFTWDFAAGELCRHLESAS